jgi:hypothetical protein
MFVVDFLQVLFDARRNQQFFFVKEDRMVGAIN